MFDDINWEDVWGKISYPFRNPQLPGINEYLNDPNRNALVQDAVPFLVESMPNIALWGGAQFTPEQLKATGERVNYITELPAKAWEYATQTSQEREGKKAAAQGGEAERRMRAIRAAHEKPKYVKSLTPAEDAKPEEEPDEDDYLNQLLMSALMAGGKATGRQAPSSYGVGAQVPFGDPWVMRRQWEQDYRNIG